MKRKIQEEIALRNNNAALNHNKSDKPFEKNEQIFET
jgi:hypothetical protein